jgi:hypothetical protein
MGNTDLRKFNNEKEFYVDLAIKTQMYKDITMQYTALRDITIKHIDLR